MAVYAAYHRHPWNRVTHFIGVPTIIFSILLPMGWVRGPIFGVEISLAIVFVAVVLAYYFVLDVGLATAMVVFMVAMLALTETLAVHLTTNEGWWMAGTAFVGGWILQLIGHVFERRRPALVDNLWQIFIAPLFLVAEALFALGFRRATRDRVRHLANRH